MRPDFGSIVRALEPGFVDTDCHRGNAHNQRRESNEAFRLTIPFAFLRHRGNMDGRDQTRPCEERTRNLSDATQEAVHNLNLPRVGMPPTLDACRATVSSAPSR